VNRLLRGVRVLGDKPFGITDANLVEGTRASDDGGWMVEWSPLPLRFRLARVASHWSESVSNILFGGVGARLPRLIASISAFSCLSKKLASLYA